MNNNTEQPSIEDLCAMCFFVLSSISEGENMIEERVQAIISQRRELITQVFLGFAATVMSRIPELLLTGDEQSMIFSCPLHMQRLPKNNGYWEYVHPNLRDGNSTQSFLAHYRMNRGTFEKLVKALEGHPAFQLRAHNSTPTYIQVAVVLWRYANNHFRFRMFQALLGYSQGSFHNFSERFLEAMLDTFGHIIAWPSTDEEFNAVQHRFEYPIDEEGPRKLKGVIGAVDGKQITIHRPRKDSERFRDRKSNLSINLTAVCDYDLRFRYIRVGDSGRCHDARVFQRSTIPEMMYSTTYFPENTYLLGDSAYPLSKQLIVPYSQGESDDDASKRKFNYIFSGMRSAIERAFGLLVKRWRFLGHYLYVMDHERLVNVLTCCVILHNICIKDGDDSLEGLIQEEGDMRFCPWPKTEKMSVPNHEVDLK